MKDIKKINSSDVQILEELMVRTISAIDICTDLICNATAYLCYCEAKLKQAKSKALEEVSNKKISVSLSKDIINSDQDVLKWSEKYSIALAFVEWTKEKKDVLSKAYHMSKDMYNKTLNIDFISKRNKQEIYYDD